MLLTKRVIALRTQGKTMSERTRSSPRLLKALLAAALLRMAATRHQAMARLGATGRPDRHHLVTEDRRRVMEDLLHQVLA